MIYLFDSTTKLTGIVNEYDSAIETECWSDYGTLNARMPATRFLQVNAARYFSTSDRMYLIEKTVLNGSGTLEVSGRCATVELEHRTVPYTMRLTGKPHAIMSSLLATLTGDRELMPGDIVSTVGTFTEDFNRPDSATVGNGWTQSGGASRIQTGKWTRSGTAENAVIYRTISLAPGELDVEFTFSVSEAPWTGHNPEFRFFVGTMDGLLPQTGYEIMSSDGYAQVSVRKIVNGVATVLAATPLGINTGRVATVAGRTYHLRSQDGVFTLKVGADTLLIFNESLMDITTFTRCRVLADSYKATSGAWGETYFDDIAIRNHLVESGGSGYTQPRMGNGSDLGVSTAIQITWGSIGERSRQLLESQGLSMVAVRDNGIRVDIIAPEYGGRYVGDLYRNADLASYVIDEAAWRTFAYVAGQGEGAAREVVQVDRTNGGERRELYVDANDIAQDTMTLVQYREVLAQRGLEKLAETRRVDVVSAESSTPELGEVVRYDSRDISAWLMCTERETVSEGGVHTVRATLGEPTPTLRQAIRRA